MVRDLVFKIVLLITGTSFYGTITAWLTEQLTDLSLNEKLLLVGAILGIVHWLMRIYDKFIKTRKYKKDNNIKTII